MCGKGPEGWGGGGWRGGVNNNVRSYAQVFTGVRWSYAGVLRAYTAVQKRRDGGARDEVHDGCVPAQGETKLQFRHHDW